jgi:ADP-ribose pyrophosphatase YjhB (NUDIX family)
MIESRLYRKISSSIPILCVDLLIKIGDLTLLVKRKRHPLKGEWWLVGGRILLGEDPFDAARRKAKEETGLDILPPRFLGYYSDVFDQNSFAKTECQTVSLVFECEPMSMDVTLDYQSSDYKWSPELPGRFVEKFKSCGQEH